MKDLIITIDFPPTIGGVQNYIYNLFNNIKKKKDFIVLAPIVDGCEEFDRKQDFKIYRKKYSGNYVVNLIKIFYYTTNIIKKKRYIKLIHCIHVFPTGIVAYFINKIFKKKYIIYTYAKDITFPKSFFFSKLLLKKILKNSHRIITISDFTKNEMLELGIEREKIIKICPGIGINRFYKKKRKKALIKKYDLYNKKIIFSVSRLIKRKGFDMVVKSLPLVINKIPNVKYLIAGEGPEKKEIIRLAKDKNLEKYVEFIGEIKEEELIDYYNLCDIFIMPSRNIKGDTEGFGIVFLEANMCEKPVIGGNSGGIPDSIRDNVSGLLVNPLSEEDIAEKIVRILTDEGLAKRLGEEGRRRAIREFDWKNISKRFEKIKKSF